MPTILVQDRRETRARRLVVQPDRHQGHLVLEAQPVLQTPAEHLAVVRRQQKATTGKPRRRTNQRLEALVGFGDRMSGKAMSVA